MYSDLILSLKNNKKYTKEVDFKKLRNYIEKCNIAYFNEGNPLITDEDYDLLLKYYEDNSDDIMPIGAPVDPKKKEVSIAHEFDALTGSLKKAHTIKEFKDTFFRLLPGIKENKKIKIVCSLKYDGNSCANTYNKGKIIQSVTRGRDNKGASLLHLFKDHKIKKTDNVGIQYEILMTYKSFDKLNSTLEKKYINPRSAVSGITSDLSGHKYLKYLRLVPIQIKSKSEKIKRKDQLKLFNEIFYEDDKLVKNIRISQKAETFTGTYTECIKFIRQYYKKYTSGRYDLNYMVDGIVVEVNNKEFRKLGHVNNCPKWMIAIKFPYQEKESVVEKFEFDIGKANGRITPCIIFSPVFFNGAEQNRVSIANYKRFNELKLGIGSKVIIQYRADTLSYLIKKDCPENDKIKPFPFIKNCEVCGTEITINENKTYAYCLNKNCKAVVQGKILNYIKSLDIMGIDEGIISTLHSKKLLNSIIDLYSLNISDISKIEGFGKKSATNIIESITKKTPYDYEILEGMGIEGIGKTFSKEVLKKFTLPDLIKNIKKYKSDIIEMEGFSDKRYNLLLNGIIDNKEILEELISKIKYLNYKETVKMSSSGKSLKFVVTGNTVKFKDRAELTNYLTERGHKVIGSISLKTDYLITNDTSTGTIKNQKAEALGIPIINEEQLLEIVK